VLLVEPIDVRARLHEVLKRQVVLLGGREVKNLSDR